MAALNTNDYAYLIPPTAQFKDENGLPYSSGFVEFYKHGTSEKYITYADWAGSLNPFRIRLNSQGRTIAIIPKGVLLDMYVYNYLGNLAYTRLNVTNGSGDGSGGDNLRFTSSDGSIVITRENDTVDFTVHQDENTYGTIVALTTDQNGAIVFTNVLDGNIDVNNAGRLIVEKDKLYHLSLAMKFATSVLNVNYASCVVRDSEGGAHDFVLDESITENYVEVSWDMIPESNQLQLALQAPSYMPLEKAMLYIHRVNPLAGGGSGSGGGEQSDWTEADPDSPAYIKHKPDLSLYALKSEIPDVPDIPTPTTQQSGNILSVDDQGNPVWTEPQSYSQQQADWSQTDTTAVDYIKNKPTIPAAQVNSDWDANSGVAQILNKPDLSVYALKSEIPTVPTIGYTEL